jgi:hypothetical protein
MKPILKKFIIHTLAALAITLFGTLLLAITTNLIISALDIDTYIVAAISSAILGLLPHSYLFFTYNKAKNANIPILQFYIRYMALFAVWILLLTVTVAANNNEFFTIPTPLHIIFTPQHSVLHGGYIITNNLPVAYVLTVLYYSLFLFIAAFLNKKEKIFAKTS